MPPTDDDLTPEEEAKFAQFYEKARANEKAAAERSKPPKDAAELVERTAHRVVELLHEEAENRQGEKPPAKTDTGGGLGFLGFKS